VLFGSIDRLLFRPLPYEAPNRLVQVHTFVASEPGRTPFAAMPMSLTQRLVDSSKSFEGFGWTEPGLVTTVPTEGGNPLSLVPVSSQALDVLGVRAFAGRTFTESDGSGVGWTVMLSFTTWRTRFGSSDDVIGMSWPSGRTNFRVIGILPEAFLLPSSRLVERVDGVVVRPQRNNQAGSLTVAPFARLKRNVSIAAAQAEVDFLTAQEPLSADESQPRSGGRQVILQPLQRGLFFLVRPYLWVVSSAIWAVLSIACVNLAILLLARGQSRTHEVAVRTALGASSSRLALTPVLEAGMICVVGGGIAVLMYSLTADALPLVLPSALRSFVVDAVDFRLTAITCGTIALCVMVAGLLPVIWARQRGLEPLIRSGRHVPLGRLRGSRLLVAIEAGFGVLLVVCAGVTVPTFASLALQGWGYEFENLYVASVGHGASQETLQQTDSRRVDTILDVVEGLPGVQGAAAGLILPLERDRPTAFWRERGISLSHWNVTPQLFLVLGNKIVAGRSFSASDADGSQRVAVINEAGIGSLWPGLRPNEVIGKSIDTDDGPHTVIGVSTNIRRLTGEVGRDLFLPLSRSAEGTQSAIEVAIRMAPGAVPDRDLLLSRLNARFSPSSLRVRSLRDTLAPSLDQPRFLAALFGSLAICAIVLSLFGLNSVAVFEATRRRHEMAIRLALGSSGASLRWLLIRDALKPALVGVAIGSCLSWWVSATVSGWVPSLPLPTLDMYVLASLTFIVATVVGAWFPARRATRVLPARVLGSP
jgi:predicted permease